VFTLRQLFVFGLIIAFGLVLDEYGCPVQRAFSQGSNSNGAACDNLCRNRQVFYDCTSGYCLRFSYPDCFCCATQSNYRCLPQTSDIPNQPCIGTTYPISLVQWETCDPTCNCVGDGYVEASNANGSSQTRADWARYKCQNDS
jgi:hypothetical protein